MFRSRALFLVGLVVVGGCRCGVDPNEGDGGTGGGAAGGVAGGSAGGTGGGAAGGSAGGTAGGAAGGTAGGTAGGSAGGTAGGAAGGDAGGAAGGTAGGAAGGAAGGTADAGECVMSSSCPGTDSACRVRTCTGMACGFANFDAGIAAGMQTAGDCRVSACDGDGGVVVVDDDTDVPADDNNPCTTQSCSAGMPQFPPAMINTVCPAGFCNATGICVQCNQASQCAGADTECRQRTCTGGMCGAFLADAGIVVAAQTAGDCRRNECDGDGGIVAAAFPTDIPNDNQQCTNDTCMGGTPTFAPAPVNSACSQSGGAVCDNLGNCVACNVPSQCGANTECRAYTCVLNACGVSDPPLGTPVAAQTPNDCTVNACDGDGGTTVLADNGDVPLDDGNDCTSETCSMGMPQHPARPQDTACDGGVCSSMAACVQCNSAGQCGTNTECSSRTCVSNTCGTQHVASGTPVMQQTSGDCRQNQCDGDGGVVAAPFDTDLPPDEPNQCTLQACTAGTPGFPPADAGSACTQMGGVACDGFGACQPAPQVVSTSPADGSSPVAGPTISVTFNVPMNPSSFTAQTAAGSCTGSVQVSLDDFSSCIAFASAAGTLSAGNTTVTFTAAPSLLVNRAHKIRVTTTATGANGVPLGAQYTSMTGFTTISPNTCDGSLVISALYGAGGNAGATWTHDFVELHNRGGTAIPLMGLTLQYASGTGSNWQMLALTGSVPAGGYFMVRLAGGTTGVALPDFDQSGTIAMGATAGRLALMAQTTLIPNGTGCPAPGLIDYVSYGAGSTACEGTAAPAPTASTWLTRNQAACGDTQSNAFDLTSTATIMPRSSTTTPLVCGCLVMNESNAPLEADYCNVQFPLSMTGIPAMAAGLVFGRIYEATVTDPAGGASTIAAQLGVGPPTANPQYQTAWSWANATYNLQSGNNDEYQAMLLTPAASGSYRYVYRFSLDQGVSWTVCDQNANDFGAGSNPGLSFEFVDQPQLTTTP